MSRNGGIGFSILLEPLQGTRGTTVDVSSKSEQEWWEKSKEQVETNMDFALICQDAQLPAL